MGYPDDYHAFQSIMGHSSDGGGSGCSFGPLLSAAAGILLLGAIGMYPMFFLGLALTGVLMLLLALLYKRLEEMQQRDARRELEELERSLQEYRAEILADTELASTRGAYEKALQLLEGMESIARSVGLFREAADCAESRKRLLIEQKAYEAQRARWLYRVGAVLPLALKKAEQRDKG